MKLKFKGMPLPAFTMAEILLSLTIIGVVAAITLPSLTGNINERTWNTQRKALFARFSQAIALMPSLNGIGTSNIETATETFVTGNLSKVLKINNICSHGNFGDCGVVSEFTNLKAVKKTMPKTLSELHATLTNRAAYTIETTTYPAFSQDDTQATAFETANGESIVAFYNPTCVSELGESNSGVVYQRKMCLNFIYDLNGKKGPNTVGKDIGFITVFYPSDSVVVAPMPATQDAASGTGVTGANASSACTTQDSDYRIPNKEELVAIYLNAKLIGRESGRYWSSTKYVSPYGFIAMWHVDLDRGILGYNTPTDTSKKWKILCVKRN